MPFDLDVDRDRRRDRGIPFEVAADDDAHALELDSLGAGLAEEVVGDAPGDGEVEELPAVEPEPAATRFGRPVDDERVGAGAPDRRRLAGDVPHLDLEHRSPILLP